VRNTPCVLTGTAYLDPGKQDYIDGVENTKKFLVKTYVADKHNNLVQRPMGFTTVFKKCQSETEKGFHRNLYLNEELPYNPVANHKFRHIKKGRWVTKGGFNRM
jgi:hypothetical protein